jgi:PAS domain S-box-containing protein
MDVTERKHAEEALRRSESYLAQAQKLSHTGSWAWKVESRDSLHTGGSTADGVRGMFAHLSEEWYRIYGFDPADGIPTWEERVQRLHPEDRARWKSTVDRALAEKSDYDVELRIILPRGVVRYIHTVGHPVLDASGSVGEFVGITMDVTERRRADQERETLRQAQADLARISRVSTMGELTASLAHEIKQPISAAVTDAETCLLWLDRDHPDLAEARETALRIIKDVTRASEIINRIGLLFKKGSQQRELIDLNEVIQEMVALLHSEAARYSISMQCDLANDLSRALGDRVQLQQVLMNLMLNGLEAMKDMQTAGELTIKSRQDDNRQLLISVGDTGVGLQPGQAEQIFDAFFTTKPQGTGMGLAISRSIVESHGGRLWVTPNPGRGTTFQFSLPGEVSTREAA